jgi:hypothetical protein
MTLVKINNLCLRVEHHMDPTYFYTISDLKNYRSFYFELK